MQKNKNLIVMFISTPDVRAFVLQKEIEREKKNVPYNVKEVWKKMTVIEFKTISVPHTITHKNATYKQRTVK